ncbi:MAG: porin family protein [Acidobacteria bacterium]|nr:porin family protein [Acidobacteriota bacterium]
MAQDVPVAEVFGGYSFFRCDAGDDISCNLNGWNAAVDFNVSDNWSAVMDFSGHYGYLDGPVATASGVYPWYDVKSHNFMFGPRFKMRGEKVTPFLHALFGVNHVNPEAGDATQNNFALAFGGGVDVKVTDKMSVRPIQLEYVGTRVNSDFQNNMRFSAGVVFNFGSR